MRYHQRTYPQLPVSERVLDRGSRYLYSQISKYKVLGLYNVDEGETTEFRGFERCEKHGNERNLFVMTTPETKAS